MVITKVMAQDGSFFQKSPNQKDLRDTLFMFFLKNFEYGMCLPSKKRDGRIWFTLYFFKNEIALKREIKHLPEYGLLFDTYNAVAKPSMAHYGTKESKEANTRLRNEFFPPIIISIPNGQVESKTQN